MFLMLVSDRPATLDQRRRLTWLHPMLVLPWPALYCLLLSPVIKLLPGGQLLAMRQKQQLLCRLLLLQAVDLQGARQSQSESDTLEAAYFCQVCGISVGVCACMTSCVCVSVCMTTCVCECVFVRTRLAMEFVTKRYALDA
jgi:hypothetical protein